VLPAAAAAAVVVLAAEVLQAVVLVGAAEVAGKMFLDMKYGLLIKFNPLWLKAISAENGKIVF
jgi:hypothetical protein